MRKKNVLGGLFLLIISGFRLCGEDASLPINRISLFSSGVGYYEHRGSVSGPTGMDIMLPVNAINDALKSLVIHDNASKNPSVSYPSEDTLSRTLKSLSVDLTFSQSLADILGGLRGAEVIVKAPEELSGRIVGVEFVTQNGSEADNSATGERVHYKRASLTLIGRDGLKTISLSEISSLTFTDPDITRDFHRALDLIQTERDSESRLLRLDLPGKGEREVRVSYVIPSPVWKVSYRLDLHTKKPVLQGWAIVDNAGDTDWEQVRLTLVSGRPVSFIQELYPPLYVPRPIIPLSIAGMAKAETYDSGWNAAPDEYAESEMSYSDSYPLAKAAAPRLVNPARSDSGVSTGVVQTASAEAAGELFLYTLPEPVSLARRQSAMVPFVEAEVKAERVSVFSGQKAYNGGIQNPNLCVLLENTSGLKLPPGPITVFDGGSYAGDALVEFLGEKDKRLIAYGEDLAVQGYSRYSGSRRFTGITVSAGVMTIARKTISEWSYTLKNNSDAERLIWVEHPISSTMTLREPREYAEKTDAVYRFPIKLLSGKEGSITVVEEAPVYETIALASLKEDVLVQYSTSGEIPAKVKAVLEKLVTLRQAEDTARQKLVGIEATRKDKIGEQDRIRQNLQAVGNSTEQGRQYMLKMSALDSEIETLVGQIDIGRKTLREATSAVGSYISSLKID